jgi:hypothetical protein
MIESWECLRLRARGAKGLLQKPVPRGLSLECAMNDAARNGSGAVRHGDAVHNAFFK